MIDLKLHTGHVLLVALLPNHETIRTRPKQRNYEAAVCSGTGGCRRDGGLIRDLERDLRYRRCRWIEDNASNRCAVRLRPNGQGGEKNNVEQGDGLFYVDHRQSSLQRLLC